MKLSKIGFKPGINIIIHAPTYLYMIWDRINYDKLMETINKYNYDLLNNHQIMTFDNDIYRCMYRLEREILNGRKDRVIIFYIRTLMDSKDINKLYKWINSDDNLLCKNMIDVIKDQNIMLIIPMTIYHNLVISDLRCMMSNVTFHFLLDINHIRFIQGMTILFDLDDNDLLKQGWPKIKIPEDTIVTEEYFPGIKT